MMLGILRILLLWMVSGEVCPQNSHAKAVEENKETSKSAVKESEKSNTGKVVSIKEPDEDEEPPTISSDILNEAIDDDIKESVSPKQQEELARDEDEDNDETKDDEDTPKSASAKHQTKTDNKDKEAEDEVTEKMNKDTSKHQKKTDNKDKEAEDEVTEKMNKDTSKHQKKTDNKDKEAEDEVTEKMNSIDLEKEYEDEEHSEILKLQQKNSENASPKVHMEFKFGYLKDEDPIIVYVVPSCLHCAKFLADDLNPFFDKFGQIHGVVVRFIISTPKDIFILKLLHNKYKNETDHRVMYWTFIDYIKRAMARIDLVKPTKKQKEKFVGSKKDPDFIKFQVIASEFKFSDDEIVEAYPNASKKFEKEMLAIHDKYAEEIKKINGGSNIETPFKTRSGKKLEELPKE